MMKRVFDTYMLFFQVNQSATALKHVFASLRLFVCKVSILLVPVKARGRMVINTY